MTSKFRVCINYQPKRIYKSLTWKSAEVENGEWTMVNGKIEKAQGKNWIVCNCASEELRTQIPIQPVFFSIISEWIRIRRIHLTEKLTGLKEAASLCPLFYRPKKYTKSKKLFRVFEIFLLELFGTFSVQNSTSEESVEIKVHLLTFLLVTFSRFSRIADCWFLVSSSTLSTRRQNSTKYFAGLWNSLWKSCKAIVMKGGKRERAEH